MAGLWPENHWALVLKHHLSGHSCALQLGASFVLWLPPPGQVISSKEELHASGKEKGQEESFSTELDGLPSLVCREMVSGRSYQRQETLSFPLGLCVSLGILPGVTRACAHTHTRTL